MKRFKLDTESRSLLNMMRSDKRNRVIAAYRSKDVSKLDNALGHYLKAEYVHAGSILTIQFSQKTY